MVNMIVSNFFYCYRLHLWFCKCFCIFCM